MAKQKSGPEVVDAGVVREEPKENPSDLAASTVRKRAPGAWKKVSAKELAEIEASGKLVGYDPRTSEVLVKE